MRGWESPGKKPVDVEASLHPRQRGLVLGRMAHTKETPSLGSPVCAEDRLTSQREEASERGGADSDGRGEAPGCGGRVEQWRIGAGHTVESRVGKEEVWFKIWAVSRGPIGIGSGRGKIGGQ